MFNQYLYRLLVHLRMSEQNIGSIVDGIEELYRSNRRHGTITCYSHRVAAVNLTLSQRRRYGYVDQAARGGNIFSFNAS